MGQTITDHAEVEQEKKTTIESPAGAVRPHQPGEAIFEAILSEDLDWKPFPAFPPSVRLAVVVGQPSGVPAPTRSGSRCRTA